MISSYSSNGASCVDISLDGNVIMIRETDNPSEVVYTTRANFNAFILGAKAGDFDYLVEDANR